MTSSAHSSLPADETLWQTTNANVEALQDIVSAHFRLPCRHYSLMGSGSYARIFLFTLENDRKIVGRILLPVRETVKTEAEVATMELVRARTRIPVPQVYLYCSTPNNPVRAEWILMEHMPGLPLGDCLENLTYRQKMRTGTDLAQIMSSLFKIKATRCGSFSPPIRRRSSPNNDLLPKEKAHSSWLQYHIPALYSSSSSLQGAQFVSTTDVDFVGPVNDLTFLSYPHQIAPQLCGPFDNERRFLEAFAFLGYPPTRAEDKLSRWAFEKTLEVYDVVAPLYKQSQDYDGSETFHFTHADLSDYNILIDPDTGAVTGVIDWEMAGFRPAWLAAVGAGWFNDDSERFLMTDEQSARGDYADETPTDALVRAQFRLKLAELDEELFRHHFQGIELRALFYACCEDYAGNTEMWLGKYNEHEWPTSRRGPFPFDYMAWVGERIDLEYPSQTDDVEQVEET